MTSRQKRFEEDVSKAKELCLQYQWPFTDFQQAESSLAFCVYKDGIKQEISICVSEDYPENSLITRPDKPEQSYHTHQAISRIIMDIHREMFKSTTERSISVESTDSQYADCQSNIESDSDDMDDYYNNSEDMEQDIEINRVLATDIEKLTGCYGEHTLEYRVLDSIDEIDIEIQINLSTLLQKEVLEAWNLKAEDPLVIRLHLSLSTYLDTPRPPKVEVFHSSKSGIISQLQKIMEIFVAQQWPKLNNQMLQDMFEEAERTQIPAPQHSSIESTVTDDKDIARIMELGYSAEKARSALILNKGDILKAVNDLMSNNERVLNVDGMEFSDEVKEVNPKTMSRQISHPPAKKKIKKINRQHSIVPLSSEDSRIKAENELTLIPSSTWFGRNSKRIPSPNLGFLIQVYQYARQRLPTLNEFCVVCDEPHVFQNGAMLKPAVCSRELCVFAFQTLGVMADAAESVATGAEVVDLLIAMTRAACLSNRKETIFNPYPTVVDPTKHTELALNPRTKDYKKVATVLENIPTTENMVKTKSSEIKKHLDEKDPLAYPLLQWIISSNLSHIVKLPSEKCLGFMKTPHQYLLLSSPPAKEAAFREEKKKYGSTFAFHGSGIENWHSIIREGLVNASGTKLQMNGAAYGKGIYLSPMASTSFGYSRMGYGTGGKINIKNGSITPSRFLDHSVSMSCIALCEVITSPTLKKNGSIWVCPEPNHVCTRFFFVYEHGRVGDHNIDTQNKKYLDEIMQAVGYRA